jgi:gamma-glutamyltranspeptidase/glutathione hydrolase/leukotriene-C4 hydrolase
MTTMTMLLCSRPPQPTGLPRNPAYLFNGTTAAVASEDITCSHLGLSILREKNGTAVDAAITTTLCIGLLNAFSSGIGGGGFMLVRVPETEADAEAGREAGAGAGVVAIDFRETSPAGSEKEMYGANRAGRYAAQVGGLAIGVPGELRGLEAGEHHLYSCTLSLYVAAAVMGQWSWSGSGADDRSA